MKKLTPKKLAAITQNINNDKEIMKKINANTYTSVEGFIDNAIRYINAIRERRMICNIESVSSSGMSRTIKFLSCEFNTKEKFASYTNYYTLFKHLGFTEQRSKNGGFTIGGCGMDMIFHTNYTIIHKLARLGFIDKETCEKLAQCTPTVI